MTGMSLHPLFFPIGLFIRDVGFMRYYQIKQIPNFLMAAPMIALSASGIYHYITFDLTRVLSLGRSSKAGKILS